MNVMLNERCIRSKTSIDVQIIHKSNKIKKKKNRKNPLTKLQDERIYKILSKKKKTKGEKKK